MHKMVQDDHLRVFRVYLENDKCKEILGIISNYQTFPMKEYCFPFLTPSLLWPHKERIKNWLILCQPWYDLDAQHRFKWGTELIHYADNHVSPNSEQCTRCNSNVSPFASFLSVFSLLIWQVYQFIFHKILILTICTTYIVNMKVIWFKLEDRPPSPL